MRGFGTICLFIVLAFIPGSPVAAQQTLTLAEGKRLVLKDITVVTPLISGGEKTLRADVSVSGEERRSRKQLSVFADEFFMFYFGVYAERKGFKSATVTIGEDIKAGSLKFTSVETFSYELQENGVWEPKHDSLKDDEPLPKPTAFDLPSGKRIFVEMAGIGFLDQAGRQGWGTNYWSEVSFETHPEAVYAISREYWNYVKDKVDPSIGVAGIYAFDRPRLGYFHFRQYMYLTIKANAKGEWQKLPSTLEEVEGRKSNLIQANFGPGGLETVWPER